MSQLIPPLLASFSACFLSMVAFGLDREDMESDWSSKCSEKCTAQQKPLLNSRRKTQVFSLSVATMLPYFLSRFLSVAMVRKSFFLVATKGMIDFVEKWFF